MRPARLFLIEFNELCPHLIQDFIGRGWLPGFKRLFDSSTIYTTDAAEAQPNLEPWVQWPTVHSGLPFAEHQAFHLGDGRKIREKCLAELLSDAGIPVGVFGSMNLNYGRLNGYVVPDPWDKEGVASPESLAPYYRVVARQVQESSTEAGLSKKEMLSFGWFLLRHGLSIGSAAGVLGQLWSERRDAGVRWRRTCCSNNCSTTCSDGSTAISGCVSPRSSAIARPTSSTTTGGTWSRASSPRRPRPPIILRYATPFPKGIARWTA